MEKSIKLQGTEDTPEVLLDRDNNQFSISGRSLPEEPAEFYKPIIAWIKVYVKEPNPRTEFNLRLEYLNSSSIKQIFNILIILEEIVKTGKEVKVIWYYSDGDNLMEIKGEELKDMVTVPFEVKMA